MDSDPPTMLPDPQVFRDMTLAVNALTPVVSVLVRTLAVQLREMRERERLAVDNATASSLAHLQRQVPPLRPMTAGEQQQWRERVPVDMVAPWGSERYTVHWGPLDEAQGTWGVEAYAYEPSGAPAAGLHVVCRSPADAIGLARWIENHHAPADLRRLYGLAFHSARAARPDAETEAAGPQTPSTGSAPPGAHPGTGPKPSGAAANPGRRGRPMVLSEEAWAEALLRHVPERDASGQSLRDRLLAERSPGSKERPAWEELHRLANEEVVRIGANPNLLAIALGKALAGWREGVRHPSRAGHFALTQFRELPNYEKRVRTKPESPRTGPAAKPGADADAEARRGSVIEGEFEDGPIQSKRPVAGSSPQEALRWARSLDSANHEHRIAAQQEYSRWGERVDQVLHIKFPGLVNRAKAAATAEARRRGEAPDTLTPAEQAAALRRDLATVEMLDPGKNNDRIAARVMVGRSSSEVDRAIAAKFADDEAITNRIAQHYEIDPTEVAAWATRADGSDDRAAAGQVRPDDSATSDIDERGSANTPAAHAHGEAHSARAAATATPARPVRQPLPPTRTPPRGR